MTTIDRAAANKQALKRILGAEPILTDVRRAIDVVPGMTASLVLYSGPTSPWKDIHSVQRTAIINAAIHEGLAATADEALAKLDRGEIQTETCESHDCVGIVTGIYTASTPVFVVENKTAGNRA